MWSCELNDNGVEVALKEMLVEVENFDNLNLVINLSNISINKRSFYYQYIVGLELFNTISSKN